VSNTPDEREALSSIRELVDDLTSRWLNEGVLPDQGLEAMTPQLRTLLGGNYPSFEDFRHRDYVRDDWGFAQFQVEQFFEAPWEFYIPITWRIQPEEDGVSAAVVDDEGRRRQAIQPTHRDRHPADLNWIFGAGDLLGFEFGADAPDFVHWRFVSVGTHGYNVFGIFTANEYGVLTVGFASNADEVKQQLESSMTSIPWYHWIAAE
jgi:hypothetical protein